MIAGGNIKKLNWKMLTKELIKACIPFKKEEEIFRDGNIGARINNTRCKDDEIKEKQTS